MAVFPLDRRIVVPNARPWGFEMGAVGGWLPSELTGLVLWLDAADANTLTLDGSNNVEQWRDKSGNANHAAAPSSGTRPALMTDALNEMPAITYDGTKTLLVSHSASLNITPKISMFAVCKTDIADAGHRRIIMKGVATWAEPYYMYGLWQNDVNLVLGISTAGTRRWATKNAGITTSRFFILGGVYDQVNLNYYADGSSVGTHAETRVIDTNTEPLRIGATQGIESTWFDGNIAEVLIFDVDLSQTNREKVEGYLAHKFGLATNLPSSHPYKSEAP